MLLDLTFVCFDLLTPVVTSCTGHIVARVITSFSSKVRFHNWWLWGKSESSWVWSVRPPNRSAFANILNTASVVCASGPRTPRLPRQSWTLLRPVTFSTVRSIDQLYVFVDSDALFTPLNRSIRTLWLWDRVFKAEFVLRAAAWLIRFVERTTQWPTVGALLTRFHRFSWSHWSSRWRFTWLLPWRLVQQHLFDLLLLSLEMS